jgi:hypothetical protein
MRWIFEELSDNEKPFGIKELNTNGNLIIKLV